MKKIALLLTIILMTGCQKNSDTLPVYQEKGNTYDLKEVANKTYLINQDTGQLSLVVNNQIIPLAVKKVFNDKIITFEGDIKRKVKYKLTLKPDGIRISYVLSIKSYNATNSNSQVQAENVKLLTSIIKSEVGSLSIKFLDKDGFIFYNRIIPLGENLIPTYSSDGSIIELKYLGHRNIDALIFNRLDSVDSVVNLYSLM